MVVTQVFLFFSCLLNIEGTAQREWSELTDRGQVRSRRALPPRRNPPPVRFPLFSKLSPCCRWSPFFSNVSSRVTGCQHACQGRLVQGGIVSLALLPSGFTLKCHFCPLQLSQLPPAVQGGPPGARQPHHPRLKPQLDGGKHRWRHLCNGRGRGTPRWDILCSKYDKIMRAR